jgi:cytochrome c peroxidase
MSPAPVGRPTPRLAGLLLIASTGACGDAPIAADEVGLNALARLGKRLFEDPSLSEPAGLSCAGCHDPKAAFTGSNGSPVPAVARGSRDGQLGTRNTPTLAYVGFIPSFHFEEATEEDGSTSLTPGGRPVLGRARRGSRRAGREPAHQPSGDEQRVDLGRGAQGGGARRTHR